MQILLRVSDGEEGHNAFDPVYVADDSHIWGRLESLDVWVAEGNTPESWPKRGVFVIVSVPGVDPNLHKNLQEPETYLIERDKPTNQRVQQYIDLRARKYSLDITPFLDAAGLDKLANGGTIQLTQGNINAARSLKVPDVAYQNMVLARIQARDPSVIGIG